MMDQGWALINVTVGQQKKIFVNEKPVIKPEFFFKEWLSNA